MRSLFDPADLGETLTRIRSLTPENERKWGTIVQHLQRLGV